MACWIEGCGRCEGKFTRSHEPEKSYATSCPQQDVLIVCGCGIQHRFYGSQHRGVMGKRVPPALGFHLRMPANASFKSEFILQWITCAVDNIEVSDPCQVCPH